MNSERWLDNSLLKMFKAFRKVTSLHRSLERHPEHLGAVPFESPSCIASRSIQFLCTFMSGRRQPSDLLRNYLKGPVSMPEAIISLMTRHPQRDL